MNKAIYGILAAAALATLKKKSGVGGSNIEGNSLQAQIKSLFRKCLRDQ